MSVELNKYNFVLTMNHVHHIFWKGLLKIWVIINTQYKFDTMLVIIMVTGGL